MERKQCACSENQIWTETVNFAGQKEQSHWGEQWFHVSSLYYNINNDHRQTPPLQSEASSLAETTCTCTIKHLLTINSCAGRNQPCKNYTQFPVLAVTSCKNAQGEDCLSYPAWRVFGSSIFKLFAGLHLQLIIYYKVNLFQTVYWLLFELENGFMITAKRCALLIANFHLLDCIKKPLLIITVQ